LKTLISHITQSSRNKKDNNAFSKKSGLLFFLILFAFPFLSGAQDQKFDSIANLFDKINFIHGEKSRDLIDELYQIARTSPDSSILLSKTLSKEAVLSYVQGSMDSTLSIKIKKRLENRAVSPFEKSLLKYSLGMHFSALGGYSDAFSVTLEALEGFKQLNDSAYVVRTLNLLGTICSHISLLNMSKDYYSEALACTNKDQLEYYRIKNNIYRLDFLEKNTETAIDSITELIHILKDNDVEILVSAYLNIGACYFQLQDFTQASLYWLKAEEMIKDMDNPRLDATLAQYFGVYHVFTTHNYSKALDYFRITKQISEKNNNLVHLSAAYNILSQTFDMNGNQDSAYYYLKKYQNLSQNLVPNSKAIEAYQAYVSAFLDASENKLTISEQKIELKNKQFTVMIMLLITIVLFATLLFLFAQQQKRKKERENQILAERLKHEKEIQQLEKEKQDEVIAAKTREITSYSLQLSNKNSVLKQILDLNTQLINSQKEVKNIAGKIDDIIQNNFDVDNEWHLFKIHFEKVHPSFFDKLKQSCNELTENNLRICAYFRIGISTKEIAQILHISPRSVFLQRHRLKKKLGLGENDDLDDFIRNI
jgi:tetratricopeptide (TPR) repeat protein